MAATSMQSQNSKVDTLKLLVSLVLVVAAIAGFYYFSAESLLYRILGMLAVFGVAVAVALTTQSGKQLISFMSSSRTEVRKMVWPTRAETTQTTLTVLIIVAILAVFLLIIDSILGWAVKAFLATGV